MSSTTGASIATGGGEEVLLWQVPGDGTPTTSLPPQTGGVSCLSWSKFAQVLAAATYHGRIGIYSQSGALIDSMFSKDTATGQAEQLSCVACASQTLSIASGGQDRILKLWDCKRKEVAKTFKGHRAAITCASFGDRDNYIISGSKGGDLLVHSTSSSSSPQKLKVGEPQGVGIAINVVQFSPFRRTVAAAAGEETVVQLFDTVKGSEPISQFKQHKGSVTGLAFSPVNELLLCTAGLDRCILFFDVQANKLVKSLTCDSPLRSLDFMNDGFTVAAGAGNGKVLVYDLRALGSGATPFMTFDAHKRTPVSSVQFQHAPPKAGPKPKTSLAGKENSAPRPSSSAAAAAPPSLAPAGAGAGARKDSLSKDLPGSAAGAGGARGRGERASGGLGAAPAKHSPLPPDPAPAGSKPAAPELAPKASASPGVGIGRSSPAGGGSLSPPEGGRASGSVEELLRASQRRVEERIQQQSSSGAGQGAAQQQQQQSVSPGVARGAGASAPPPSLVPPGSAQQQQQQLLRADIDRIQRERAVRGSGDALGGGGGGGAVGRSSVEAAALLAARQARSSLDSPLAGGGGGSASKGRAVDIFSPLPIHAATSSASRDPKSFSAVRDLLADAQEHRASPAGSGGGALGGGGGGAATGGGLRLTADLPPPPPPARRSSSNFAPPSPSVGSMAEAVGREGRESRESREREVGSEQQPPPLRDRVASPMASVASLASRTSAPSMRDKLPDELLPAVAAAVQDTVNEIRDAMKQDMENMHLDMLRQFHMQQTENRQIMQEFGRQNAELNAEVRRLREEVMRLRNVY